MRSKLRLVSRFIFMLLLLALLFSYAMFQGGFVSWFLFYAFSSIFVYYVGYLFYPIKAFRVSRLLSHQVITAGEQISVTVRVKRRIPFPLYYCILEDVMPLSLDKLDRRHDKFKFMDDPSKFDSNRQFKKIKFPWFKRVFEWTYDLDHIPRGEHNLGSIRIRTGDVFGFTAKEHIFNVSSHFIAYPSTRVIKIGNRLSSLANGSSLSHALNFKQTNVASSVREYVPGDKLSWIHWKQTAQKNKIITKEFDHERNTDTLLIFDRCHYQGMNLVSFEGSIEVVAALIKSIEKQASGIEMLSIGADTSHFPFHHDPVIGESIRQHLTKIKPSLNQSFPLKLKEEMKRFNTELIIMIITTRIDVALQETIKTIQIRTRKVIVFYIQASQHIGLAEKNHIKQLRYQGVSVCSLTEKELVNHSIEVNV